MWVVGLLEYGEGVKVCGWGHVELLGGVLHSEFKKNDTCCSLLHFMKFAQCVSQRRHGPVILLIVTVMSTLL